MVKDNLIDLAGQIPEIINQFFLTARNFLWSIEVFFINFYAVILILLFFALIALLIYIPVKVYPLYEKNVALVRKLIFFEKSYAEGKKR